MPEGSLENLEMLKPIQAVLAQEKDPQFKMKLRERMWKIEGIFAEAKAHHGLRKARYLGRAKVQIQVYVVATVQNLKRLATSVIGDFKWKLSVLIFGLRNLQYFPKTQLG